MHVHFMKKSIYNDIEVVALNLINLFNNIKIILICCDAWNLKNTPKNKFDIFINWFNDIKIILSL